MTISLAHRPPDRPEADGRDETSRDEAFAPGVDSHSHRPLVEAFTPIVEDGLISDARRRARRRRTRYGVTATVAALAFGATAYLMLAGPLDDRTAPFGVETDDAAWPAPPADEAAVVAEWVRFHAGWAYVYEDGRVVWRTDLQKWINEQRLSPHGLHLVRTGEIDPLSFALDRGSIPAEAWSDPIPKEYRPASYAICPVGTDGSDPLGPDADEIEALLPDAVRALVAGTSRTFTHGDWGGVPQPGGSSQNCFILAPGQTTAVWAHMRPDPNTPADDPTPAVSRPEFGTMTMTDGTTTVFWSLPVLPHGVGGSWGG